MTLPVNRRHRLLLQDLQERKMPVNHNRSRLQQRMVQLKAEQLVYHPVDQQDVGEDSDRVEVDQEVHLPVVVVAVRQCIAGGLRAVSSLLICIWYPLQMASEEHVVGEEDLVEDSNRKRTDMPSRVRKLPHNLRLTEKLHLHKLTRPSKMVQRKRLQLRLLRPRPKRQRLHLPLNPMAYSQTML